MACPDNLQARKEAALQGLLTTSQRCFTRRRQHGMEQTGPSGAAVVQPLSLLPALPKPLTPSGQAGTKPNSVLFTQPQASSMPNISYVLLLKGYDLDKQERYRAGKGSVGLGSRAPSSTGEKQMKPPPHPLLKRKLPTRKTYMMFKRQAMRWEYSHSRASWGSRR